MWSAGLRPSLWDKMGGRSFEHQVPPRYLDCLCHSTGQREPLETMPELQTFFVHGSCDCGGLAWAPRPNHVDLDVHGWLSRYIV